MAGAARPAAADTNLMAVTFRGEAFRDGWHKDLRSTCCLRGVANQWAVKRSHDMLFSALRARGFALHLFSATRPCTSTSVIANATQTLAGSER